MTSENIKDLRNMADMLAKDYQRLADDMRAMRDCLNPIMDSMRDLLQTINDLKELGMSDSEIQSILERSKENKEKNG